MIDWQSRRLQESRTLLVGPVRGTALHLHAADPLAEAEVKKEKELNSHKKRFTGGVVTRNPLDYALTFKRFLGP